jgi:precorrin-2/cobalt-factor-2 C20-methyltransferase
MPLGDGQPKADHDRAARSSRGGAPAATSPCCGGDPFFYGSFMYLHARLARECESPSCGVSLMYCAARRGAALGATTADDPGAAIG